jgi:hypothetical protein
VFSVNGKALPPESNEIRHIRQELQSLRKHVDSLLDTLSIVSLTSESSASLPNTKRTTVEASAAAAGSFYFEVIFYFIFFGMKIALILSKKIIL